MRRVIKYFTLGRGERRVSHFIFVDWRYCYLNDYSTVALRKPVESVINKEILFYTDTLCGTILSLYLKLFFLVLQCSFFRMRK